VDFLITIFNTFLYRPLFNILILLYDYLPGRDFGLAIIILTVLIKLLFYPLGEKAIKSQKVLSELQPKVKEIQEKYKNDKERQTKEMMELYKREKINPFSGCLPLLIQLPVLIALYRVFWQGFQPEQMALLYNFVPNPGIIKATFFGIVDLAKPNMIMAFLAGIFQFFQTKMSAPRRKEKKKTNDFSSQLQSQMQYMMPVFIVFILFRLPSAIGLYWLTTTLFTIFQQYFILKSDTNIRMTHE